MSSSTIIFPSFQESVPPAFAWNQTQETPGSSDIRTQFARVTGNAFHTAVCYAIAQSAACERNLTLYDSYNDAECWLSPDTLSGFAIQPDHELTNVFSIATVPYGEPRRGDQIMRFAITRRPYLHLNCYDEKALMRLYKRYGFNETRREPNWKDGNPDIVFMTRGKEATLR